MLLNPMLKFSIITLFPEIIKPHLKFLPFKKAIDKNIIKVELIQLRDFADDKHRTVDDKPYGGGIGMVLMPKPIYNAVSSLPYNSKRKIIGLAPSGKTFTQQDAKRLSYEEDIVFISGRYEGIDQRILDNVCDEVFSIGNYVLSGGELPSLVIMESITRILPDVLEKEDASKIESFSDDSSHNIEYPQYTRPEIFNGWKVPKVLLNGNHKEIEEWRLNNSKSKITN